MRGRKQESMGKAYREEADPISHREELSDANPRLTGIKGLLLYARMIFFFVFIM